MKKNPKLIMYVGCMWSGKTTSMLALLDRYKYQKKNILAIKPKIDNRYSDTEIKTHGGFSIQAISVSEGSDVLKYLSTLEIQPDIIAVDELFMIPGISKSLIWLYRSGFDIVTASLDLSSDCKPFEEVKQLLPWATEIHKCKAVCVVCGDDAYYSYRMNDDTSEILIGGDNIYESRCQKCHPKFKNKGI